MKIMKINENMMRFLLLAILFIGIVIIAALSNELHSYPAGTGVILGPVYEFSSVSELIDRMPLEEEVHVPGQVSRILDDHVSKNGYEYQQFFISDGNNDLKIFCSKYKGSAGVKEGDKVLIKGTFQKYNSAYEIYLECKDVEIV